MKKIIIYMITIVVALVINGCSTDDGYYSNFDSKNTITLFLVDEKGFSYGGIPYKCDSTKVWRKTLSNGEFTFIQPDTCIFDFTGLDGIYGDNFDDIIHIVDDRYDGKRGIPYECVSFGVASTYSDGSFDYDQDDVCSFYL